MLTWPLTRALLISATLLGAACHNPCDALASRAASCGFSPGRYVDDRQSTCTGVRREVAGFDRFAQCVVDADCEESGAIDRCRDRHLGENGDSPCTHLRSWAAACGLEPVGLDAECASLDDGMTADGFARWVACITTDGCPHGDDQRYDRCQALILPQGVANTIDACVLYIAWTEACAGQGPDFAPIAATSLTECVALAEPFTPASFLAYATCLETKPCDDIPGRIECLLLLTFLDTTPVIDACERLLTYAETCQSPVGGGSVQACTRLFARFAPASVSAYVDCLEARGCEAPEAAYECLSRLQLN